MLQQILTVSDVNSYIQTMMDGDGFLSGLCVRGEISNYKLYPSGHHYFSLKDASGSLKCVMFKSSAFRLRFRPENGMMVLALGRVTVYPRDGVYQLYCTGLMPDGVGDLHMAFEQLKKKLAAQGLFDETHKKPVPRYPKEIAIVTSPAGAAVRDMLRILKKRYPIANIKIIPVRVQGMEAPEEIANAIQFVNKHRLGDLIITGRGGGSMEDLWAFNEEIVAKAIYASKIPVISAVGHEPDVTIADYVADLRAATPSNGAELAVPDQEDLQQRLAFCKASMIASATKQLRSARARLSTLSSARVLTAPAAFLDNKRLYLDSLQRRLLGAAQRQISEKHRKFGALAASLDAMSPLKVIARGYAVAQNERGEVLRSVSQIQVGETASVLLSDGRISAAVINIEASKEETDHGPEK